MYKDGIYIIIIIHNGILSQRERARDEVPEEKSREWQFVLFSVQYINTGPKKNKGGRGKGSLGARMT